jgi:hypothetical protein
MEQPNSTTKCGGPVNSNSSLFDGVDFPVAPDFESVLPSADPAEVYRACEALLPVYLAIPGERERRKADGITAEFTM